ncbi:SsrA-binding protein SmpB [Patescibacteria group bacterium]|nr:SsrA-binding protein SmpB [Patescibacteria group bacterium]
MSLITNRKAHFNYEITDTYAAGIELFGYEVKSLKGSHGSIEGAHVTIRGNEAYIVGMFIPPYQTGNTPKDYDPYRNRRLLLKKAEILDLSTIEGTKGLTIVPLSVYNKGTKVKLDIATAKGKKKFDKRETLKKRDSVRDVARDFKDR